MSWRAAAGKRGGWPSAAWAALLGVAVALLYRPVVGLRLMGDSYQWVQHAHHAMHRWPLLLADLDSFYRPLNTWTLALDRLAWPWWSGGYHLTNVLLLLVTGLVLAAAARRLGLRTGTAWVVAAVWTLSPFVDEPAIAVALRFQFLLLLAWLAMVLAWPAPGRRWTWARGAGVAAAALAALLAKETWVMTPALVAALAWGWGASVRRSIRSTLPFALAALAYVGVYFALFPSGKGYFSWGLHVPARIPHQLAVFLELEGLHPAGFTLDWKGVLALLVVAAAAWAGLRRRRAAAAVGLALLVFPTLPTLLVPFLPVRYLVIPYAGFLLLVAAALEEPLTLLRGGPRWAAGAAAALVIVLVLAAGVLTVRGDLAAAARVSRAHAVLLAEARRAAPRVSLGRPTVVVRAERVNPLRDIAKSPAGQAKLYYQRPPDPYALIDAAALFEWVLRREDTGFVRVDAWRREEAGRPGRVLVHRPGGFVPVAGEVPDLAAAADGFLAAGLRVRVIRPMVLVGSPGGR